MKCQGLYDRKYAELHLDRNAGTQSTKKLWEQGRKDDTPFKDSQDRSFTTQCSCCSTYQQWVASHSELRRELLALSQRTQYYDTLPNEMVTITQGGSEISYLGTIRASRLGPCGPCTGIASDRGDHPYTCDSCDALIHGKTSTLNRKLHRANKLKHPRNDATRATKPGVTHKFCSSRTLEVAIQAHREQSAVAIRKADRLSEANSRLLHNSWHCHTSSRPFIETLLRLLEEGKLSDFDMSFLQNWLHKKDKGRVARADEQARNLAVLFSNRLGEKMYTTTAPMLGLPSARQARRIRAKESAQRSYLPGLNGWALDLACSREVRPLQNGMDGTRVVRVIELYQEKYLVGKEFSPELLMYIFLLNTL